MRTTPRRPLLDAPEPPGDAAAFIAAARVARLGTADAAGRPLVVPVCYAFDGHYWYSAVDAKPKRAPARALKRVRNIRQNPWVSVLIDHYDEDWSRLRWVIIHGRAELLRPGREHTRALDLLAAKYPQYTELTLPPAGDVIRVTPHSYVLWRYAA
jgi:PPOX class probable F420-dependent enzyme